MDHEFLIAKFRLKLKKVGKATWTFRYDLSQIPYDYTMEVMNRFNGSDLVRVPEELWTEHKEGSGPFNRLYLLISNTCFLIKNIYLQIRKSK